MRLSQPHRRILRDLMAGHTLKAHRYLDGRKEYRLHPLAGPAQPVAGRLVDDLTAAGLIQSNQKFPAATYLLTDRGAALAQGLTGFSRAPLSVRNFDPST